ncbi:hypothetical protein GCM10027048_35730 [Hymenobacter coalescens]
MKHSYTLVTLGLLGFAASASGQALTNNGAQLTVTNGAVLYINGGFENKSGSTLLNNGTVEVTGDVTNAGTVDASGTGTLSLTGSANQVLSAGGASFANVLVNKPVAGSEVTVPTNVTVTGQLTLTAGSVRTAATTARVILPVGATLSGETAGRYVKGNLQMQRTGVNGNTAVTFPDGTQLAPGTNNLGTVTITRTAGLNTAGVSYGTNDYGNKGIDRIWQVVASGAQPTASKPVTLTLSWPADDDNGNTNLTQSRVWRSAAITGPWVTQQAPVDASSRSISSPADALGFFSVSNISNPLPVTLLSFTAERRGADAWLRWATAQEKDNARFEVEVSLDGQQFRRLGAVNGQGTTTQRHDYEYLDARIARYATGLVYYRLRQVDTDGKATLSEVRTVSIEAAGFAAQAAPNPFGAGGLKVQVNTKTAGAVSFDLHDAVGRALLTHQADVPAGGAAVALAGAGRLPVGVYFLTVRQGQQLTTLKVVRE